MREFASEKAIRGLQKIFDLLGEYGGLIRATHPIEKEVEVYVDADPMEDGRIASNVGFLFHSLDEDEDGPYVFRIAIKIDKKITEVELLDMTLTTNSGEQMLIPADSTGGELSLAYNFDAYMDIFEECSESYIEVHSNESYVSGDVRKISLKNASLFDLIHTAEGFEILIEEGLAIDTGSGYQIDFAGIIKLLKENGGTGPRDWFAGM